MRDIGLGLGSDAVAVVVVVVVVVLAMQVIVVQYAKEVVMVLLLRILLRVVKKTLLLLCTVKGGTRIRIDEPKIKQKHPIEGESPVKGVAVKRMAKAIVFKTKRHPEMLYVAVIC